MVACNYCICLGMVKGRLMTLISKFSGHKLLMFWIVDTKVEPFVLGRFGGI